MGYYMAMLEAFQPNVPIFIRWTFKERAALPFLLGSNKTDGYLMSHTSKDKAPMHFRNPHCGETFVYRRCHPCFYPGVGPTVVNKFKESAYRIISKSAMNVTSVSLSQKFSSDGPIVVTFAHRGLGASRSLDNADHVIGMLAKLLPPPVFNFQ